MRNKFKRSKENVKKKRRRRVAYAEREPDSPKKIKYLWKEYGGGRGWLWSKGVSRSGGIRGGKRGMCAPFFRGGWLQRTVFAICREPRALL